MSNIQHYIAEYDRLKEEVELIRKYLRELPLLKDRYDEFEYVARHDQYVKALKEDEEAIKNLKRVIPLRYRLFR